METKETRRHLGGEIGGSESGMEGPDPQWEEVGGS